MLRTPFGPLRPLLRCPVCGSDLEAEPVDQGSPEAGDCGLLRCPCTVYPVLDGVPILRAGRLSRRSIADARVISEGPDVREVAEAVRVGSGLDALVDLLAAPVCPWPLNRVGPARRMSQHPAIRGAGRGGRKRRVRHLLRRRDALTAEDWMAAFYLHAPEPFDPFSYFFFRFGTPRYLAALGLASALPASGPVLDLACGYGHVAHALTAGGRAVVGLDQNFHQVWTARHYVAPGAAFVCADADAPLPLADGSVRGAVCVDAFHYLHGKAACLAELDRVAAGGAVLLSTVGNALAGPADGGPLTPDGYAGLLDGWRWCVRTEADVLDRYLDGRGPDLSTSSPEADVRTAPWLSIAAARRPEAAGDLLRDHGRLGDWPHARGRLTPNPLYEDGALRLPSPWYEVENGRLRDYMPARLGADAPPTADLVARAAFVGLPERYARRRRPWAVAANRAVLGAVDRLRRTLRSGTAPG